MFRFYIILIIVLISFSCKKDKNESILPLDSNNDPVVLTSSFSVSNIKCYPYDTTNVTLQITVGGGQAPYNIVWDNGAQIGAGPFTFFFKTISSHTINVTDANNVSQTITYSIQRNQLDSLTYDYRDDLCNTYAGLSTSSMLDINTMSVIVQPPVSSTVAVSKANNFSKIMLSTSTYAFNYNWRTKKYSDGLGHMSGRFSNDSLYYGGQPGLGPNWYHFEGKKIN